MTRFFNKHGLSDRKNFLNLSIQFFKFGIVGLSNTVISLAVYYFFVWINPNLYLWGNVIGWIVSVANAFFWNSRYVFHSKHAEKLKGLLKSYLAYGTTFLLSMVLLLIQVEWLGISEIIAPIINLLVTIPLNFVINKFWTFK